MSEKNKKETEQQNNTGKTTLGNRLRAVRDIAGNVLPKRPLRKNADGSAFEEPEKGKIGVIFSGDLEYTKDMIRQGIDRTLSANGYRAVYKETGNQQSHELRFLKEFRLMGVKGMIIEPSRSQIMCRHMNYYNGLEENGFPFVFIQSTYPQMTDRPKILIDDSKGGYLAARHLISTGRRNIVGIFKADDSQGYEMHRGYVLALQEAGLPYRPEMVIWFHTEDRKKKPVASLAQLLKSGESCDGIICYNDEMAKTILKFLSTKNIAVPKEIAVTGYGNTAVAKPGEIGITTIAKPDSLLGMLAGELILEQIKGVADKDSDVERMLSPELIIRGTSVDPDTKE